MVHEQPQIKDKTTSLVILRCTCLFNYVDTCTVDAKAMVGKIVDNLAEWDTDTNCSSSHCTPSCCALAIFKNAIFD